MYTPWLEDYACCGMHGIRNILTKYCYRTCVATTDVPLYVQMLALYARIFSGLSTWGPDILDMMSSPMLPHLWQKN